MAVQMSPLHITSYAVVVPGRQFRPAPSAQVYLRRRVLAGIALATVVLMLLVSVSQVLANRGGDPASVPTVRPATAAAAAGAGVDVATGQAIYVVQPGDTLWSIAEQFHGDGSLTHYVDVLVDHNDGTELAVGQRLLLP